MTIFKAGDIVECVVPHRGTDKTPPLLKGGLYVVALTDPHDNMVKIEGDPFGVWRFASRFIPAPAPAPLPEAPKVSPAEAVLAAVKAKVLELTEEYGRGRPSDLHAFLRDTLIAAGFDIVTHTNIVQTHEVVSR